MDSIVIREFGFQPSGHADILDPCILTGECDMQVRIFICIPPHAQ